VGCLLWSNTETNAEQYTPINYPENINNIQINVRATNHVLRTDVDTFNSFPNIVTLTQYVNQSKMWQQPLLEKTIFSDSIDHLRMDKCVYTICSDGGVRNSEAGIGLISTANGEIIMTNKVRIPSTYNDINSYREEAFGIATAAATYYLIQKYKQINNLPQTENSLRILCDNKSVIDKVNSIRNVWTMTTKFFTSADADIITAIAITIHHIRQLPSGAVTLMHVKGHQDRLQSVDLSEDAKLNIEADRLATESLLINRIPIIDMTTTQAEL
jgi:hypothetical protein